MGFEYVMRTRRGEELHIWNNWIRSTLVYNHGSRFVWKLKIGSGSINGYRKETIISIWSLCGIGIKKKEKENNRLRDWRRENQEEAKKATIATQQSITHNRWKGLGTIFNSPVAYQVLQLVEEVVITIAQIDVEEVNGSTSDGTW
jgi:hypothetical protein